MALIHDIQKLKEDVTEIKTKVATLEVKIAIFAGLGSTVGAAIAAVIVKGV